MEKKIGAPLSERSQDAVDLFNQGKKSRSSFVFPGLSLFFKACIFIGISISLLWFPSQWLFKTFQKFLMFQKVDASHLMTPVPEKTGGLTIPLTGKEEPEKQARAVVFRVLAPAAKAVFLGGSFNNFDARHNPLERRPDGIWETSLDLFPGVYYYKFKVDGQWILDPSNPEKTPEPRVSSVLDIK